MTCETGSAGMRLIIPPLLPHDPLDRVACGMFNALKD